MRWNGADQGAIQRPEAWLTTVTSRLALDRLRSAQHRRETYVGPWLPEPTLMTTGPAEHAELAESLSIGFLAVLEELALPFDDRTCHAGQRVVADARGCRIDKLAPKLTADALRRADGSPGLDVVYTNDAEGGPHTIRLWRMADGALIAGPYAWSFGSGTAGWKVYTLPAPVSCISSRSRPMAKPPCAGIP